jgi:aminomuconate-semialdehyde/2-hydroxymuconate-6-semialdehyde dehydrogenase
MLKITAAIITDLTLIMKIKNYINGELLDPIEGNQIDNIEPATGKVFGTIPDSQSTDVQKAVDTAQAAFPSWSSLDHNKRAQYMFAIADGIRARFEDFVAAESQDNGKPISLARAVDIPRAISNFEHFGHAITQFSSESHSMPGVAINYTLRQPIGIVGCISPWNLPLYLFSWKIAPALAAGNCVIAKPSEVTPLTGYLLSKVCKDVGLPPGVLNILHGTGLSVGDAIVSHPKIKAISFTGGTTTGKIIAAKAAPMFKKLSLELGGKNPNIIFADCDYDEMLKTTVRSSFANQGQICLCGSRIIVEDKIYEKFVADFTDKVSKMKVGDPNDANTKLGALVSKPHMEKVLSYIEVAKEEGGKIETGGHQVNLEGRCSDGYFVRPTVITGLSPNAQCNQEEIFGPVVTITPFSTVEEALSIANGVVYGLSCTIWTNNIKKAHNLASQIEAGVVWINCWLLRDLRTPFGGMKASGVGREGGLEVLRFFTEAKNVCVKL